MKKLTTLLGLTLIVVVMVVVSSVIWVLQSQPETTGSYVFRIELTFSGTSNYTVFSPFPRNIFNMSEFNLTDQLRLKLGNGTVDIIDSLHGKALMITSNSSRIVIEANLLKAASMQLTMCEYEYVRRHDPGTYKHWIFLNATNISEARINILSQSSSIYGTHEQVEVDSTLNVGWQQIDAKYTIVMP